MIKINDKMVEVGGHKIKLTNLQKIIWPEGLTKAHLIKYYFEIAPFLIPYLADRPIVLHRYPDGIAGDSFYQKDCPDYAPEWIRRIPVEHKKEGRIVNYIICDSEAALIWLANQACIEIHAWLSKTEHMNCPDLAVIDLDPPKTTPFKNVLKTALVVKQVLEEFGLKSYPKTSGARGIHILIPLAPRYQFPKVTAAMKIIAETVQSLLSKITTVERLVSKRGNKIYIDYLQNGKGKTIAFQYSARPLPGAPVSCPLYWSEVASGEINPAQFNISNMKDRIRRNGDIFKEILTFQQLLNNNYFP